MPRLTLRVVGLVGLLGAGCSAPVGSQQYLDVTVRLGAGVTSSCVRVVLTAEGGATRQTRPMKLNGTTSSLRVAVYRDELPATVSVQALGFSDEGCTTRTAPVEESALTAATFAQPPTAVALLLERAAAIDADGDGFSPPSDCDDTSPAIHPGVPEVCSDGKDNDCSAGADCVDPACDTLGCGTAAVCGGGACHEQVCSDGLDGDGDGAVDCADSDCDQLACGTGPGARCSGSRCAEQLCNDGIDNDGDGPRDCVDSDCAMAACGVGGSCADGGCREPAESICDDGLDSDADNLVDCDDPDCGGRRCSDGDACTTNEVCSGVSCGGGTVTTCMAAPGACFSMAGTCAPATGLCSYAPLGTAAACEDGNACSRPDHCDGDGGCISTPLVCAAAPGPCFAAGVCQPSLDGGCTYAVMSGASCSDGNACTTGDSCAADGGCQSGATTPCVAAECQVFVPGNCELDGGCRFTPAPASTPCDGGRCNAMGSCALVADGGFFFPPDNFVPAQHPPAPPFLVDCALTFDSTPGGGFNGSCSGRPVPVVSIADGGAAGALAVLSVSGLTITDAGSLTLVGSRPVVLAVFGDATLSGPVLANTSRAPARSGPGAGPALTCGSRVGGNGRMAASQGGGGAGAGFFSVGGLGGGGSNQVASGGDGGVLDPGGDVPLLVGCRGGTGASDNGNGATPAGRGGGALQLSVSGMLTVNSTISASGEGGDGASGGSDPGGGGGGSGGAITLQAQRLVVTSLAKVTSNGGAGGGGAQGNSGVDGRDGEVASVAAAAGGAGENGNSGLGGDGAAAALSPGNGGTVSKGGGGGGGAMGRIFFKHADLVTPCSVSSTVLSPAPVRTNCP